MKENGNDLQEELEIRDEVESTAEVMEAVEEVELRDVEQDLAAALEEIASLKDRMLRLAADSENFKKRMERERIAGLKYAGEQIFREMLPVVDNLERAIGLGAAEAADPEKNLAALLEGVQLTLKSLVVDPGEIRGETHRQRRPAIRSQQTGGADHGSQRDRAGQPCPQ